MTVRRILSRLWGPVILAGLTGCAPAGEPWGLQTVESPLVTERTFSAGDELSGIASLNGADCVVVSNEARYAQMAELVRNPWRLRAGEIISLTNDTGEEMDLEAVAANPQANCYYALGSHAVSKQKGHPRKDQEHLFRIPADPVTKKPDSKAVMAKSVSLKPLLLTVPEVKDAAGKPLQQNGLNLEGMTFRDGKLLIGCRAPNINGSAPVLEVEAEAIFSQPNPTVTTRMLPVGPRRGIRDMASAKLGVLLLVGDSGSEASSKYPQSDNYDGDKAFTLMLWKPGEQTPELERIGTVPAGTGKAEGLMVVEEGADSLTVLVLFDGAYNGAPILLKLTPPHK